VSPLNRNLHRYRGDYEVVLGSARLYLDDLEVIRKGMQDAADKRASETEGAHYTSDLYRVRINAGDASATDLDDLRDASPEELKHILLSLIEPRISVHVGNAGIVRCDNDDSDARLVADDIGAFVNDKSSWRWRLSRLSLWSILTAVFAVVLVVTGLAVSDTRRAVFIGLGIGIAIGSVLSVLADLFFFPRRFGYVQVIAAKRSEARGLTQQERRNLWIATIAAVIGAVVGVIGAKAIG